MVTVIVNKLVRVIRNINDQEYIKSIMSEGLYFVSKWTLCSLVDEYSNMLRQFKIGQ